MITQRHISPDGAPLQTEFTTPERKDAKPISCNPAKRYKKAYGFGTLNSDNELMQKYKDYQDMARDFYDN